MSTTRTRTEPERGAVRPTLVVFASQRSGICRRFDSLIAQVLQRRHNHDTFRVVRVDVDERPDLAGRFGIDSVPTLVVLERNSERLRVTEPKGMIPIEDALSPWLH
jgi:thioredoxin-like negative regulator of GroEL